MKWSWLYYYLKLNIKWLCILVLLLAFIKNCSDYMNQSEEAQKSEMPSPLYFPLDILKSDDVCEAAPSLHQLIQTQFEQIINQFFKQVKTNPDYYFFCPSSHLVGLLFCLFLLLNLTKFCYNKSHLAYNTLESLYSSLLNLIWFAKNIYSQLFSYFPEYCI